MLLLLLFLRIIYVSTDSKSYMETYACILSKDGGEGGSILENKILMKIKLLKSVLF
jgi:hypothetical protein